MAPYWTEDIRKYRKDFRSSSISSFWHILRPGIWHTTGLEGFEGIVESGAIEPNPGNRDFTFPQTENSYGYLKGYVSLFDFGSAIQDECIAEAQKWSTFFKRRKPVNIALGIRRELISDRLIENARALKETGYKTMWIPGVEAWHDGPIPCSAIESVLIVSHGASRWRHFFTKDTDLGSIVFFLNNFGDI